ncbi:MAG: hypothetical protein AAF599_15420, partial [Bacteroidota bacterium]
TNEQVSGIKPQKRAYNTNLWAIPLVLIFLGILGFFLLKKDASILEYQTKLERISSLKGQEIMPSVSPNGQYIAFAWRKTTTEPFQIYVRSLAEDNPRKLSRDTATEFSPIWLPSGDALLFLRIDQSDKKSLIQKSIIGEDEIKLVDLSAYTLHSKMILYQEGKYLIFSAKTRMDAPYQLYAFDLKQAEIKQLTNSLTDNYGDIFPSLGKEKDQLYFLRAEKGNALLSSAVPVRSQLYAINFKTKEETLITTISDEVKGMSFYPDLNQHLVWVTQQLGLTQLLGIDEQGETYFIKSVKGGVAERGMISAEGKLYYEFWQSKMNVFKYSLLTSKEISEEYQEYINSTQWDWGLRSARESDKMAFLSYRSGYPEIWMTSSSNPEQVIQITDLESEQIPSISLSSDGQKIAFCKIENNQSELYVIQSNGQNLQKVSIDGFDYSAPDWSADGESLFYSSNRSGTWNIWQYNFMEQTEVQITFQGGKVAHPHPILSNQLLFIKENADTIWRFSLANQTERIVCEADGLESLSWILSSKGIYYLSWQNGVCKLLYYDFNNEQTYTIKTLEHMLPNLPVLSISPDEKSIYLAQSNGIDADILAIEIDIK